MDDKSMSLVVAIESFGACLPEFKALASYHYDEISEHKAHGIPLDPQYDEYLRREAAGALLFITLRDDGVLVGYHISFIAPGLHYKTCLTALADIFFVRPDQRGKRGGLMLFKAWEDECKRRGVKLLSAGIKTAHANEARRLMDISGFTEAEVRFWKFLEA